jgi:alkylhydroperoxidase family enzyme
VGKDDAPATWLGIEPANDVADGTPFDRVFGLIPSAHAAFRELDDALFDPARVDPALVALCRLRVEQLVGADSDHDELVARGGVSTEQLAEVHSWPTSARYRERDRAALNFTEKFVIDASSVDDDDCAALRAHLSDPEVTALAFAVAMADAGARFRLALAV